MFVTFDSQEPTYESKNKPVCFLPEAIDFKAMQLVNAQIPLSFYNIHAGNNVIEVTETGPTTEAFTLPIGNYDLISLSVALKAGLDALATISVVFTITEDLLTHRLTITGDATFIITANTTMNIVLGYNDLPTADSKTQEAEDVYNLSRTKNIFVKCENLILSKPDIYNRLQTQYIAKIPIDTTYGFTVVSAAFLNLTRMIELSYIHKDRLIFELYDDLGYAIDLNGLSFCLTFKFT